MQKRFAHIWFQYLLTDWLIVRRPELKDKPFAFVAPDHGRIMITAVNPSAHQQGVKVSMRSADAKAICPNLETVEDKPGRSLKLLKGLGEWCIRYSPIVMIDEFSKDGLFMDISGCAHLWGGEEKYLKEVVGRLRSKGYTARVAIADTLGAAWAISHYGVAGSEITTGKHTEVLSPLPPEALRLSKDTLSKLRKLGFYHIEAFIAMPRSVLRRRFGEDFLTRLGQALGTVKEVLKPLNEPLFFQEKLTCLDPIKTRQGIEIALERLLEQLCRSLHKKGKGLRTGILTCHRLDSKLVQINIGTNVASNNAAHLFKLFQLKIEKIRPGLGIELFVLEAVKVDSVNEAQEILWTENRSVDNQIVINLLDRITSKVGVGVIHRYLPAEHFWPERSFKKSLTFNEKSTSEWRINQPRPIELLEKPESIEVMSIIPDFPPRFFIYEGVRHIIVKADGPERIEQEWWIESGYHRDYYRVEDEEGQRYWLFRSGHYGSESGVKWFIHGFFA